MEGDKGKDKQEEEGEVMVEVGEEVEEGARVEEEGGAAVSRPMLTTLAVVAGVAVTTLPLVAVGVEEEVNSHMESTEDEWERVTPTHGYMHALILT